MRHRPRAAGACFPGPRGSPPRELGCLAKPPKLPGPSPARRSGAPLVMQMPRPPRAGPVRPAPSLSSAPHRGRANAVNQHPLPPPMQPGGKGTDRLENEQQQRGCYSETRGGGGSSIRPTLVGCLVSRQPQVTAASGHSGYAARVGPRERESEAAFERGERPGEAARARGAGAASQGGGDVAAAPPLQRGRLAAPRGGQGAQGKGAGGGGARRAGRMGTPLAGGRARGAREGAAGGLPLGGGGGAANNRAGGLI
jgi:hypothetical protein